MPTSKLLLFSGSIYTAAAAEGSEPIALNHPACSHANMMHTGFELADAWYNKLSFGERR